MNKKTILSNNESGFVLVTAMIFLVILTLLGVFATNTTVLETQIAGNDRLAKLAFYNSDGGVQAGIELIEQNISCPTGFSNTDPIDGIDIYSKDLAYKQNITEIYGATSTTIENDLPSDTIRAARIVNDPTNRTDTAPHVNIALWGVTRLLDGTAIQMAAGYEGKGKSAAGGGSVIDYELHSQYVGVNQTETKIAAQWLHMVGNEGICNY